MEDTISPVLARLHTNILIEAQYLPVVLNIRAERESRVFVLTITTGNLLFTQLN